MGILIVDDSKIERMILKEMLESEGHAVYASKNGEEALQTALDSIPDLIISDILMPVMDGFSLCKSIRSDNRTAHIPFVFYTATYTNDEDEALGKKIGADGFFRKPMAWDDFYPAITAIVNNAEKNARCPKSTPEAEGDFYKLYNERLIKKLEDKVFDLEKEVVERKMAEEALKKSREELRELSKYLQSAIENERIKIARDIHDELGQVLTAIKFDVAWLKGQMSRNRKPVLEKADSAISLIDIAIQSVRRIVTGLRPGLLDDIGLIAAIEWQAGDYEKLTGVKHSVVIEPENIRVDKYLSTALFRVCQESLTNAARHSKASHVLISVIQKNKILELVISDNGTGIDENKISDSRSFGLMGMRERIAAFGGSIEISGSVNGGTRVMVKIPVK
ncbi:MAG: response regulator [Desulfobacteraceae bacterium]|nr:MAG: response regulator [Desulfobacteraceae bacterium]